MLSVATAVFKVHHFTRSIFFACFVVLLSREYLIHLFGECRNSVVYNRWWFAHFLHLLLWSGWVLLCGLSCTRCSAASLFLDLGIEISLASFGWHVHCRIWSCASPKVIWNSEMQEMQSKLA